MFNSYQELFHSYVDFYKTSLYEGPSSEPNAMTTALPAAAHGLGRCRGEQTFQHHNQASGLAMVDRLAASNETNCIEDELTNQSSAAVGAIFYQASAGGELTAVKANNLHHQVDSNLLIAKDPRLLAEGDGSKLVRLGSFNSLETNDLLHIASVFLLLVAAKRLLSRKLTSLKQLDKLGLRPKDRERLDESVWRLLYYSFSSVWLICCCLKHDSHLLLTTRTNRFNYHFQIDWPTYAIFMIEAAFYLHATYALIFEDVWRRDSPMMLVHHLAAVFTTLSLYATRTHQIGLASTVLRDTCDVLLEVTKLTKCFHIQHGRRVRSLGTAVNCFLAVFAAIFALNQLYYFPLFCLFHGLQVTKLYNIQTPVMIGILTCGLLFLLLDLLWFGLILRLLYYMALAKPMKDLREYDDEDEDVIESDSEDCATGNRLEGAERPAVMDDKED